MYRYMYISVKISLKEDYSHRNLHTYVCIFIHKDMQVGMKLELFLVKRSHISNLTTEYNKQQKQMHVHIHTHMEMVLYIFPCDLLLMQKIVCKEHLKIGDVYQTNFDMCIHTYTCTYMWTDK